MPNYAIHPPGPLHSNCSMVCMLSALFVCYNPSLPESTSIDLPSLGLPYRINCKLNQGELYGGGLLKSLTFAMYVHVCLTWYCTVWSKALPRSQKHMVRWSSGQDLCFQCRGSPVARVRTPVGAEVGVTSESPPKW